MNLIDSPNDFRPIGDALFPRNSFSKGGQSLLWSGLRSQHNPITKTCSADCPWRRFDAERAHLRAQLSRQEQRTKDLELAAEKLQAEVDNLKKQQAEAHQVAMFQAGLNQPQVFHRNGQKCRLFLT